MGTIRIQVAVGAALFAGLMLIDSPACAEPEISSPVPHAPLKLTPPIKQPKKLNRTAETTKPVRTAHRRKASATRVAAHKGDSPNILRGKDRIGLIAMLPWWRADRLQPIRYLDQEAESQVLTAADAWLAAQTSASEAPTGGAMSLTSDDAARAIDLAHGVGIADRNDIDDIDSAAEGRPQPSDQSWLHALIAIVGGALAAASTARFLFV